MGHQNASADVLLASRDTSAILRYNDKTGAFLGIFASTNAMTSPEALTLGPDGNLYVADRVANSVFRFDGKTGAFINTFVSAGSGGLSGPRDLIFGPDGNLYVSSNGSNQVLIYDGATGAFLRVSRSRIAGPRGIAFQGGVIYIANYGRTKSCSTNSPGPFSGRLPTIPASRRPEKSYLGRMATCMLPAPITTSFCVTTALPALRWASLPAAAA